MSSFWPRINTILLLVGLMAVVGLFATRAFGGPLDPAGAPGSTHRPLGDIAPSWHRTLAAVNGQADGCGSTRFTCVLGAQAILDNETGLVWERYPHLEGASNDWSGARYRCRGASVGGRQGWRLAGADELATLRDDSPDHMPDGAPLPPGDVLFWTATEDFNDPSEVALFQLDSEGFAGAPKSGIPEYSSWCVRGPQSSHQ